MEMVGDSGVRGTSFDITVDPDKLKAVKVYVATEGSRPSSRTSVNRFHFRVEELNPAGMAETARYDAIFHAPGSQEEED